jgi:hypothetical protein
MSASDDIDWSTCSNRSFPLAILILLAVSQALAQTKPAPDKNTPKAVLLDLYNACAGGDRAKALALIHAPSPAEQHAAGAMTDLMLAEHQLLQAMRAKFGNDAGVTGPCLRPHHPQAIVSASEEITGDRARVITAGAAPMSFIRIKSGWKISAADLLYDGKTALEESAAAMTVKAQTLRQIAADISIGNLPTPAAVADAMNKNSRPTAPLSPPPIAPASTQAAK